MTEPSNLRDAAEVVHEVYEEVEEYGPFFATTVIEADRAAVEAAVEAATIAEVVAWLRTLDEFEELANEIEAGEWKQ